MNDVKVSPSAVNVHGDKSGWVVPLISGLFELGTQMYNYQKSYDENQQNLEYNSPVNQVKRLKQAGLNPSMVYGQVSPGQSNYQSPQFHNPSQNVVNQLAQMQSFKNAVLQNNMLEEQINSLRLDNRYKEGSMKDRLLRTMYGATLAGLQARYQRGQITRQEYDNEVARIHKDIQVFLSTTPLDFDDEGQLQIGSLSYLTAPYFYSLQRSMDTNKKVYQDYLNAVKNGKILDAHLIGAKLNNSYQQIALDYAQLHNRPFNNVSLVDGIITALIDRITKKYGVDDPYQWIIDKIFGE